MTMRQVLWIALVWCSLRCVFEKNGLPAPGPESDVYSPSYHPDHISGWPLPDSVLNPEQRSSFDAQPLWDTSFPSDAGLDHSGNASLDGRGDIALTCGPSTCAGCCADKICKIESSAEFCGNGGQPCQRCVDQQKTCLNGICAACTSTPQCSEETICINPGAKGTCVSAYNRKYRITVVSAQIKDTQSDGTVWDLLTLPDPYVEIIMSGQAILKTPTIWDSLTPTWKNAHVDTQLAKNNSLVFKVWDDDLGIFGNCLIGTISFEPEVPLQVLKNGTYSFTSPNDKDGLRSLTLTFQPL